MPKLVDRLRAANRRRIAARRLGRPPRPTPFGFLLNGIADMRSGRFEPAETALVRTLLARADRFVNVGANVGYYCCFARQAEVATLALEPVPTNAGMFIANMRANGWTEGVTLLPVAAGEKPGFADIYGVGTGSSLQRGWAGNPESLRQTVPVVRLDDVVRPPAPDETLFVLMDVEGFELPALRGATGLVGASRKPVWMIEIIAHGDDADRMKSARDTFELMLGSGYSARSVGPGLRPVTQTEAGVTNYLFHDSALGLDDVLGPEDDRATPFRP